MLIKKTPIIMKNELTKKIRKKWKQSTALEISYKFASCKIMM